MGRGNPETLPGVGLSQTLRRGRGTDGQTSDVRSTERPKPVSLATWRPHLGRFACAFCNGPTAICGKRKVQ